MSAPTLARVPAGVTAGGQFSATTRGEADLTLSAPAPAPEPVAPPKLTATQRDALRALGETGTQWPAGRGRYSSGNDSHSRYSARTLDALVETGAARYVTSAPGAGVMPYYEPTLTAQHDSGAATWTVTAPDEVADDAYVAAIVHGHRKRGTGTLHYYEPEALTITRGESADGTTTFAVKVAGEIPSSPEARAARAAGREAALPLSAGDRQTAWIESMSSGYVHGAEFAHPHLAGAQASFRSLVDRLRQAGVDVVEEPAGTRGGVGWRITGVTADGQAR
jgi:hypothetical protein